MRISLPKILTAAFIVMLATNNVIDFKENVLSRDYIFYGALFFAMLLVLKDLKLAKALGGAF